MGEKNEEDEGIGEDPPAENNRVIAILKEEELGCVSNHNYELQDLRCGHVPVKRAKKENKKESHKRYKNKIKDGIWCISWEQTNLLASF